MPPEVAVFGAAGFTGALSARLLDRHPTFELTAVTARSDVGRRLDDLYPYHRVPIDSGGARPGSPRQCRRSDRGLSPRRRGGVGRRAPPAGVRVVDLSGPTSGSVTQPCTESGTATTRHPSSSPRAVYGLAERYREPIRQADLVANRAATPRPPSSPWPRWPARGLIADVVLTPSPASRGRPGRPPTRPILWPWMRTCSPTAFPATGTRPRSSRSSRPLGAEVRITFTPHLLPLDQGELLSCYVTLADPGLLPARPEPGCTPVTPTAPSRSSS